MTGSSTKSVLGPLRRGCVDARALAHANEELSDARGRYPGQAGHLDELADLTIRTSCMLWQRSAAREPEPADASGQVEGQCAEDADGDQHGQRAGHGDDGNDDGDRARGADDDRAPTQDRA